MRRMRDWNIVTCFFLDFLTACFLFPKLSLIKKRIFLNLSGAKSKADLAAKSTLSFPLTPTWRVPRMTLNFI